MITRKCPKISVFTKFTDQKIKKIIDKFAVCSNLLPLTKFEFLLNVFWETFNPKRLRKPH